MTNLLEVIEKIEEINDAQENIKEEYLGYEFIVDVSVKDEEEYYNKFEEEIISEIEERLRDEVFIDIYSDFFELIGESSEDISMSYDNMGDGFEERFDFEGDESGAIIWIKGEIIERNEDEIDDIKGLGKSYIKYTITKLFFNIYKLDEFMDKAKGLDEQE